MKRAPQVLNTKTKKARRPRPSSALTPSSFRPHVLSRDRLQKWTTPHTSLYHASLTSKFSSPHISALFLTMLSSLTVKTRENYGSGLLRFHQFCDASAIPEASRLPASEDLLGVFCASWAGRIARMTVDGWLSGLQFWHTFHGAPWHGGALLRIVKRGVTKLVPASSQRPRRPPVTIEHMHSLFRGLDLSNSFDAAVWAVAATAFWSCCRLGELTVPSRNGFDPKYHVIRGTDIRFAKTAGSSSAEYATFHIPWSKTTLFAGANITATDNGELINPVTALRHHLQANSTVPPTAPLFAFESTSGTWEPMTKAWFMDRCNEVWAKDSLLLLTGHCFRIGGATEHLLRGVAPEIVQALGRWRSQAFMDYWRRIESILPLFLSNSLTTSRVSLLRTSMNAFRKKHNLAK
ncbi:hypothetical protein Hypma_006840 [Hypsizygus marmoreus]|uniref:DNA breaking-rejoining enzyme n=1 Tax=Hypsizygus marmoreus TaxID=39966 RepID=A0A369K356_HYPMA|nr:hypothetical protein Hypma_006840 [Hypsizygus marmoreus]